MAPLLEDPRIRRTWNQISHNAETATETAAEGIWTFTHSYVGPCLSGVSDAVGSCVGQCFPSRDEHARRARQRGRAEFSFDFYDDWDEDDFAAGGAASRSGLLGWGNSEWDRLLAGSGARGGDDRQPGRKRGMSYGTRGRGPRRKSAVESPDPTVIPSSNALGFLGRLPFKFGGTLRYKPSAADLQEHPGASRADHDAREQRPLMDDDSDDVAIFGGRPRSSTASSGDTSNSMRSRGDLFPSDDEADAVPLDDEFAMALERRSTNPVGQDDRGSGRARSGKGKKRAPSSLFSRNTRSSSLSGRGPGTDPEIHSPARVSDMLAVPSMEDLHQEEERIQYEEDQEVERKRQAAHRLAVKRGLSFDESKIVEPLADRSESNAPPESQVSTVPFVEPPETETESKDTFVPARLPHF